jgi:hypothetical protein
MTDNLERTYDGIIIGAGHHGMILGCYLAKCGLNVLLVDRRLDYGGGLSTKQVTKPGFYHNLHSINHFHISHAPWFADLGLGEKVTYITPRYEFGQAHHDGTALVFGRDLEETLANVARFSKKDAATFREWNRKAEEITRRILLPERYAEPLPREQRELLLSRTAVGRDFLAVTRRQPLDVINELFENEHVKLLFLFKVSLFGTWLTDTLSKSSPIGSGLVASFARPGGNITGNTILGSDVVTKRLQIIKDALPAAARIALLWNPDNASNAGILQQLRQAVPLFHMTLVSLPARTVDDFKQVYAQLAADPPDALLATNDPLHHDHMIEVIDFLLKHRIPGMFQIRQNVVDGGLMSYGANFADLFRQGALYVDKILHGSKPQDLPFEQPTKFDLTVNLKTAKAIGITFSANFLALADEVIQ